MVETRSPAGIGPYRIIAPIGVGSSSTVYRVVHEPDGTEAALKVLADNHSLVSEMRQRFHDEATLLASVEHPGLARVYAVGETDRGQPYLAMELADRGDLRSRLDDVAASGRWPSGADVLALGRQLADALDALHAVGIVHRDVTPGNILIRADSGSDPDSGLHSGPEPDLGHGSEAGSIDDDDHRLLRPDERLMIADLGLAKDLAFASGLTAGGGTRGFAAPEQREVVSVVDHRTDVYGATAVIRWLVEGSPLGHDLEAFVARGLADEPEDRFDSMQDWFDGLTEAVSHRRRLGRSRSRGGAGRGRRSMLGPGLALLGLVAVVAALVAAVALNDRDPELIGPGGSGSSTTAPPTTPVDRDAEIDAGTDSTGATIEVPAVEASTTSAQTTPSSTATANADQASGSAPVTLAPTTTDPQFAGSPRAYIGQPIDGATIDGDLAIVGDARSEDGIAAVRLVIRDLDSGLHWHPETMSWETEWIRFELPVEPVDGTEVTWGHTIPADRLVPGRYLIRVWAVATPGNGDPVSDVIAVVVP